MGYVCTPDNGIKKDGSSEKTIAVGFFLGTNHGGINPLEQVCDVDEAVKLANNHITIDGYTHRDCTGSPEDH